MTNPIQEAQRHGQSIWYDNIRRGLLTSGELARLIQMGVTGVTSNPTIFEKAIAGSTDYDEGLLSLTREGKGVVETYEALAMDDIRATADLLRPVYDGADGADGYISLEVSPSLAHDTEGTVREAKRLFAALERPNVMVKVPATPEGVPAIRALIGEGININVTLIFSLEAHRRVMEAYMAGLEDLDRSGGKVHGVASVASFFVSRVDTAVDGQLEELIRQGRQGLGELLGKAAISNAKMAYREFEAVFGGQRFAPLVAKGARVQRTLWASTGTKNPAYSDVLYIEPLIGPNTVNTMPPATLTAFQEHGSSEATIRMGVEEAEETLADLEAVGISMEQVTGKLLADGVKSFADSFDKLMANIEEKMTLLLKSEHLHPKASLGPLLDDVEAAMAGLEGAGGCAPHLAQGPHRLEAGPDRDHQPSGVAHGRRHNGRAGPCAGGLRTRDEGPRVPPRGSSGHGWEQSGARGAPPDLWQRRGLSPAHRARLHRSGLCAGGNRRHRSFRTLFLVSSKSGARPRPSHTTGTLGSWWTKGWGRKGLAIASSPSPTAVRPSKPWPGTRGFGACSSTPPTSVEGTRYFPTSGSSPQPLSVWMSPSCWTGRTVCVRGARPVCPPIAIPAPGWARSSGPLPRGAVTRSRWSPHRPLAALGCGWNSLSPRAPARRERESYRWRGAPVGPRTLRR